jgi:diguanylate cyclase (GGDEF)-like protein
MQKNHLNPLMIIIIGAMLLFVFYLQYTITQTTESIKTLEVTKAQEFAGKIERYLKNEIKSDSLVAYLDTHPDKRHEINKMLHAFLTNEFQYIFLLTKDKKGHYRFLLDASIDDPVSYRSIFFPNSDVFDQVYRTGKAKIIKQEKETKDIWLSLVYPIQQHHRTQMLMVIDLSKAYSDNLTKLNDPLIRIVKLMQLFLILSILLLAYLMYTYTRLQRALKVDTLTSAKSKYFLHEFFSKHTLGQYNLIMIDIDEFKSINARFGYEMGDVLLKQFSQTVKEKLPKGAYLIRNGGTEFLVVIPKDTVHIVSFAQDLFALLKEKTYLIGNEPVKVTVSMSVMDVPGESFSLQKVERILDERLLEVKNLGKNSILFVGKHDVLNRIYTLDQIRNMLDNKQLVCLYQPVVDNKTKKAVRFEVLVRLIDKSQEDQYVTPAQFMDVIKGTSQYLKMSKLVLKEAFKTLRNYPELYLSVNLDLNDLYNTEVMSMIMEELKSNRSLANRLNFEILEEHEIKDYDRVVSIFSQLKMYGSEIAIDDFGSGYANYSHVLHLDIDTLKVDGSLIKELSSMPERAEVLLRSIQTLAQGFGCGVVAEFVSDENIYERVKALGFEYSQGYYFGKPEPIEHYMASLK